MPAATITSRVEVAQPPATVRDLLDDMAAHARWTDHYITDWDVSDPSTGVGASARVKVKGGRSEITVVEATPTRVAEQGVGGPAGRWRTTGTYELEPAGSGTRITFVNTIDAPTAVERFLAKRILGGLQADNDRAMERLADVLSGR